MAEIAPQVRVFEARGIDRDLLATFRKLSPRDSLWRQTFSVYVGAKQQRGQLAMLGAYTVQGDAIRFTPRYPLEPGATYRAELNTARLSGTDNNSLVHIEKTFDIPAGPAKAAARVVAVYPSSPEVPENLLRVYLHFSVPMSQGSSYQFIHLWDATEKTSVDGAFLEVPQELWDASGKRLTLLLDPGRVKQGLLPREEAGPVLVAGHKYVLSVDQKWRDVNGHPLQSQLRKEFHVGKPVATRLNAHEWKRNAPATDSREPLLLRFPEPLDQAMLERVLRVVRVRGTTERLEVSGIIRVFDEERCWSFTPREPWKTGRYAVEVSTLLEDRAGNSLASKFEVDRSQNGGGAKSKAPRSIDIGFEVERRVR